MLPNQILKCHSNVTVTISSIESGQNFFSMNYSIFRVISPRICRTISRNYAFKSDLKIKWLRPEPVPITHPTKSGDLSKLPPVDPNEFTLEFRNSKELQDADDLVKSLFTLENNRRNCTTQFYKEMLIKEVQRHPLDYGSMESKLAKKTATIRRLQEHMEQFPRDISVKVFLKEAIEKRKKFLKYLRRWDYRRFEWILEKLDLEYKPHPEYQRVTRKESLRKLTNIHCDTIKSTRLEEYRKTLEGQQEGFLEQKLANLEFLRKEQQECEVPVTVQQEEINAVKKQLEEIREKKALNENEEN